MKPTTMLARNILIIFGLVNVPTAIAASICTPEAIIALRGVDDSVRTSHSTEANWFAMCQLHSSESSSDTYIATPYGALTQYRDHSSLSKICSRRSRTATNDEYERFYRSTFSADVQKQLVVACAGGVDATATEAGGQIRVTAFYGRPSDGLPASAVQKRTVKTITLTPPTVSCRGGDLVAGADLTLEGNSTTCMRPSGERGPITMDIAFQQGGSIQVGVAGEERQDLMWGKRSKAGLSARQSKRLHHFFGCEATNVNFVYPAWVDCRRYQDMCSNAPKQLEFCRQFGTALVSGPGENLKVIYLNKDGSEARAPVWLLKEEALRSSAIADSLGAVENHVLPHGAALFEAANSFSEAQEKALQFRSTPPPAPESEDAELAN